MNRIHWLPVYCTHNGANNEKNISMSKHHHVGNGWYYKWQDGTLIFLHIKEIYLCLIDWNMESHSKIHWNHCNNVISAVASKITGVSIVCKTVSTGSDERKHQSSASMAFLRGIHRWPVKSPHKKPLTRKMFPFEESDIFVSLKCSNLQDRSDVKVDLAVFITRNYFSHTICEIINLCIWSGN